MPVLKKGTGIAGEKPREWHARGRGHQKSTPTTLQTMQSRLFTLAIGRTQIFGEIFGKNVC